jgi:hypothetical protein
MYIIANVLTVPESIYCQRTLAAFLDSSSPIYSGMRLIYMFKAVHDLY